MKPLLGAAVALALVWTAGQAAAQQQVKWRFQTNVPVNTFFFGTMPKAVADNARQMSGGRIDITPFGVNEIVPVFQIHQEVAKGTVEMGWTSAAGLVNADIANGIFANYPGGPAPETYVHWYYQGGGKQLWQQYRREVLKVHSMLCGIGTTEFFAHSHKPIRTRDDLKGLKHRTLGVWASVLNEKFGGAAVTISGEELFGALERKTIDSLEWAGPGGNIGMGFHKVARYIITPGAHQPSSPVECVINLDKWNALSEADKQTLENAALLTTFTSYMATGQEDQKAMPEYRKQGNEFVAMDPKLVKEIQDETRAWLETKAKENEAKGNPWAARLLKSITEYQEQWAANAQTRAWDRQ